VRSRVAFAYLTRSVLAAVAALMLGASPAVASRGQVAILQDDPQLASNPVSTLQEMRHLGVQMIRVSVR
jgi:hypothetical protein